MDPLERCIEHLRALVAHRSDNPGGDEVGLCRVLADHLRELGADEVIEACLERENNSPGAYVYAKFGEPTLLINVHLDTVPANSGWERDPFVAHVTEDRVYGLGSCDIKGAIAAVLTALHEGNARNIGVLFSGDEENGSRVVPHFLAHTDTSKVKRAVVCEPTTRLAGIAHRGMLAYRARYVGCGGHSSKADHLEKPMVELAKLAVELDKLAVEALERGPTGMKGLCMNVAKFSGGIAHNVVPNMGELAFSLRPAPGFDRSAFEAQLEGARIACHPKIQIECITEHHPFACQDEAGIRELVGPYAREFVGLDFWTEAALMQDAGIDAVVIGPGDISQAHSADEFVLKDDLAWALDMFRGLIARHAS